MPSRKKTSPIARCRWASNEWNIPYHDAEWGVPVHDDRLLFEFLILEGAQAGLSWDTILRKRERYRQVFDNFDPHRVARYDAKKVRSLIRAWLRLWFGFRFSVGLGVRFNFWFGFRLYVGLGVGGFSFGLRRNREQLNFKNQCRIRPDVLSSALIAVAETRRKK